jgi:hypothetical protein
MLFSVQIENRFHGNSSVGQLSFSEPNLRKATSDSNIFVYNKFKSITNKSSTFKSNENISKQRICSWIPHYMAKQMVKRILAL